MTPFKKFYTIGIIFFAISSIAHADDSAKVELNGNELFRIHEKVGSFKPSDRAAAIVERIKRLEDDNLFSPDSLEVTDSEKTSDIIAGDVTVASFTDDDAKVAGVSRSELANNASAKIKTAIISDRVSKTPHEIFHAAAYSLAVTLAFFGILYAFSKITSFTRRRIFELKNHRIKSIRLKNLEMVTADRVVTVLNWILSSLRIVFTILLLFFYIPLVLSFFPWTANLAPKLFGYILNPLHLVLGVAENYIPDLFFIAVIFVITRYLLKFIRFIFLQIENGTIQFNGFHQEWAEPTYKLVRVMVFALTLVVIYPYLPGSKSSAFKGVSVFLGVLLSFGSSSAISNLMAGVVLTYMRPFRLGDRVQIADTVGDVIEKSLLVTRIRTIKNTEITVPNSMVLASHIVNFSSAALDPGLILHTTVTIGYDAPWKQVHQLLIDAALKTELVLSAPAPFVLQTSLDDSYVSYQINAYTHAANRMATTYSNLFQNIQDVFNAAQVEIMSPTYAAIRDGNQVTTPREQLPKTYRSPAFKVSKAEDPK